MMSGHKVNQSALPYSSMPHRYPTRFQAKQLRAAQEKAALNETIAYARNALVAAERATCFCIRIEECAKLFNHLYENPILLTGYERFRETTWNKMNETEKVLLSKLQEMPARLAANNQYNMGIRCRISYLLDLMELVRTKYW